MLGRVAGLDMTAGSSEAARCSTGPDAPCRAPVVAELGASCSTAGMVNAMGAIPGGAAESARVPGCGGAVGYGASWEGSPAAVPGALCSSASRADGLGAMPSKGAGADRAAGPDGVPASDAPHRGPVAAEGVSLRSSATRAATSDLTAPLSASSLHGGLPPPLVSLSPVTSHGTRAKRTCALSASFARQHREADGRPPHLVSRRVPRSCASAGGLLQGPTQEARALGMRWLSRQAKAVSAWVRYRNTELECMGRTAVQCSTTHV